MFILIIEIMLIGVGLWLINTYVPMDAKVKTILNVVVLIVLILWLLNVFGVFAYMGNGDIPRLHR